MVRFATAVVATDAGGKRRGLNQSGGVRGGSAAALAPRGGRSSTRAAISAIIPRTTCHIWVCHRNCIRTRWTWDGRAKKTRSIQGWPIKVGRWGLGALWRRARAAPTAVCGLGQTSRAGAANKASHLNLHFRAPDADLANLRPGGGRQGAEGRRPHPKGEGKQPQQERGHASGHANAIT
eukprot:7387455-Prymnesium_polylepis.2